MFARFRGVSAPTLVDTVEHREVHSSAQLHGIFLHAGTADTNKLKNREEQ